MGGNTNRNCGDDGNNILPNALQRSSSRIPREQIGRFPADCHVATMSVAPRNDILK